MKKTGNNKRNKLTLRVETVRTLTSQDLTLVVGGACKHGTANSSVPPPDTAHPGVRMYAHPTC